MPISIWTAERLSAYFRVMLAMLHEDRRAAVSMFIESGASPNEAVALIRNRYQQHWRY